MIRETRQKESRNDSLEHSRCRLHRFCIAATSRPLCIISAPLPAYSLRGRCVRRCSRRLVLHTLRQASVLDPLGLRWTNATTMPATAQKNGTATDIQRSKTISSMFPSPRRRKRRCGQTKHALRSQSLHCEMFTLAIAKTTAKVISRVVCSSVILTSCHARERCRNDRLCLHWLARQRPQAPKGRAYGQRQRTCRERSALLSLQIALPCKP
jgi:hypothetical protein